MIGSRRSLLGRAAAALLLFADPVAAADGTRLVPARKLFPYLDAYLRLPAAQRNRFGPVYVLTKDRPASLTLIDGDQRIPIPIGVDGEFLRLPTAAQWARAQVEVAGPAGAKYGLTLKMELLIPGAAEMDAAAIRAALDQLNQGIRAVMGPVGAFAPKAEQVVFHGVGSGEAVLSDGRRTPLPLVGGAPAFSPAKAPGAVTLRFPKAPTALRLS